MKKKIVVIITTIVIILAIIIIVAALILSRYYEYKDRMKEINEFNLPYEEYRDREFYGTEIATAINKAVDDNEKAGVEKDENGKYIQNDTNSVNIEIKIIDLEEETIYDMNTLYNGGMATFVKYYSTILFKCTTIEYNSQGKVKYVLFEQISQ